MNALIDDTPFGLMISQMIQSLQIVSSDELSNLSGAGFHLGRYINAVNRRVERESDSRRIRRAIR